MRTMIDERICLGCGITYQRPISYRSHKKWAERKFCGQACRAKARIVSVDAQPSKVCELCSKVFWKPIGKNSISKKRWDARKHCSNKCWRRAFLTNSERPNAHKPKVFSNEYRSLHQWVNRNFEQKQKCELCSRQGDGRQLQWANISDRYLRERSDWACLCSRCHKVFDCSKWVSKQSAQFQKNFKYLLDKASSHTEKDD